jgi:hypothetical protein
MLFFLDIANTPPRVINKTCFCIVIVVVTRELPVAAMTRKATGINPEKDGGKIRG